MTWFRVKWVIDIDADTPGEAAQHALDIQRDPESDATVFTVQWDEASGRLRTKTIDVPRKGYDA